MRVIRITPRGHCHEVVGDTRSNNSNRLVQVSNEIAGTLAHLGPDIAHIETQWGY